MSSLSSKTEQIETLKCGKGLQHLLNYGFQVLGNPLYIHDTDYKLIAYTQNVEVDDFFWNELIKTGEHGKKSIEFFKNEDFIDAVANAKTITPLISDKLKYDRIIGKIRNKENITVACMDIVASNKPFESGDAEAFEAFCDIVSKEISKNDFYQIYGEQYQEKVICDLIDGNIRDKRLYARRVGSIYEGLKNNIYIAAMDISKINYGYAYASFYKNLLKNTEHSFKYAVYDNFVTFIFSSDDESVNFNRRFGRLIRVLEKNNMNIGISSSFENLFIAQKYFTEAVDALYSGIKRNTNRRIHLYNEIS